ncbi:MAG TPA: protein-glutamate O-methyltransferase CheR [Candidatus Deferrimicrobiaceae bacterium]
MRPVAQVDPARDAASVRELTDADFVKFRRIIHETAGITLNQGKKELLRARLGKVMRRRGIPSFHEYLAIIENDASGEELTALLDAVSTNVTSFFREPDHFHFMESTVLPALIDARRGAGERKLRIWCAGCSTGEEPYSLAVTLRETLPDVDSWDTKILATDISTRVLQVARHGIYSRDKLKAMPSPVVNRWFVPAELHGETGYYRVQNTLRKMITFARLNLQGEYPFKGPFDAIFCRNVMIYFDRPTQETLVNRCHHYLADGGYLFIGHSESLNSIAHPLKYIRPAVYRKAGAAQGDRKGGR